MGEGFRDHIALRALLQAVIADGGRGIESFLDIALFEDIGFFAHTPAKQSA